MGKKKVENTLEEVILTESTEKIEDSNISLEEVIEICTNFTLGLVTVEELNEWCKKVYIKPYMPILDKMSILSALAYDEVYLGTYSCELKTIELEVKKFFKVLIKGYTNIEITEQNEDLCSFENFDILYPMLEKWFLTYCEQDYKKLEKMIDDNFNFNFMQNFMSVVENIDSDVISESIKTNKELIETISKNKKMVSDLSNIITMNDPMTKTVADEVKRINLENIKLEREQQDPNLSKSKKRIKKY